MSPNNQTKANNVQSSLRVALIGQSSFAVDVFRKIVERGHVVVGIFTVLDKNNREDPLAIVGRENNVPVFKFKMWRKAGKVLPQVLEAYKNVNAELNVLPYCSQFIPIEIINHPCLKSVCYHPSLLPRHRGASSINWTLMCGDKEAGLTIFWADEGLDTGPILLQEKCTVEPNDTADSLYGRFLYPAGVAAITRAVDMIAQGTAPKIVQSEKGATYDPMLNKSELRRIDWTKTGVELHNFVRGLDSNPGALCQLILPETNELRQVSLFGSTICDKRVDVETLTKVQIDESHYGLIHQDGLLLTGSDGVLVNIQRVRIDGRTHLASKLANLASDRVCMEYYPEEKIIIEKIKEIWEAVLQVDINDDTDFFLYGASSLDVVRVIEQVKELTDTKLNNQHLYLAPIFEEFCQSVILTKRASIAEADVQFKGVEIEKNGKKIKVPLQLFVDGKFVDGESNTLVETINPADETVICQVQMASRKDVDLAVAAAKRAFESGEWSKISARERGQLLYRLSDLMQEHSEELATLESIDSGAVYTLALKTHVGMSIETWRYFAGCADKIQGSTVPISHARPNKNLTFTKKEPIGVCGIITPWNYPLMMLSWKMAACLAAGNTVVMKPAEVCPLTALKFAELSLRAGIPPGVINVLPGSGSECGGALAAHPDVRKVGFTGSTRTGQIVMKTCAESNLKRVSLELGGKSPLVIFSDCDLEKAARTAMQSVFFNKGENCIAAGRIFVAASIHDEFVRRVVYETRRIKIGDPFDRSVVHGPQNHLAHLNKLIDFVARGVSEGAKLECGGERLNVPGLFFQPAVFTQVEDGMYIAREESFGPIMIISEFDDNDMDAVIRRANATEYGLASGVFTKDISKALRFSERVDAGTVFINTYNKTDVAAPFGGFKQSGFGKDLGQEALNEYLKTKCITVEY